MNFWKLKNPPPAKNHKNYTKKPGSASAPLGASAIDRMASLLAGAYFVLIDSSKN